MTNKTPELFKRKLSIIARRLNVDYAQLRLCLIYKGDKGWMNKAVEEARKMHTEEIEALELEVSKAESRLEKFNKDAKEYLNGAT